MPLSLPPVPPAPLALFFICIQLPSLSLAMLFSPAGGSDHVMRKTPRKRVLVRYVGPKTEPWWMHMVSFRIILTTMCISVLISTDDPETRLGSRIIWSRELLSSVWVFLQVTLNPRCRLPVALEVSGWNSVLFVIYSIMPLATQLDGLLHLLRTFTMVMPEETPTGCFEWAHSEIFWKMENWMIQGSLTTGMCR